METGVEERYIKCLICGGEYRSLNKHLEPKHNLTAREYKEKFEMCYNQPLECKELTVKRREQIKKRDISKFIISCRKVWIKKGEIKNKRGKCKQAIDKIDRE